jgi:hypothetical protein
MHYSDRGCWAARGRAAQQETARGRALARRDDSGAQAKQPKHGGGTVHLGGGGPRGGGAGIRLQRLGRDG